MKLTFLPNSGGGQQMSHFFWLCRAITCFNGLIGPYLPLRKHGNAPSVTAILKMWSSTRRHRPLFTLWSMAYNISWSIIIRQKLYLRWNRWVILFTTLLLFLIQIPLFSIMKDMVEWIQRSLLTRDFKFLGLPCLIDRSYHGPDSQTANQQRRPALTKEFCPQQWL